MNVEGLGRAAAFMVLAGTILATAITVSHRDGVATQVATTGEPDTHFDTLHAELVCCSRLAPDATPDPACKEVWAENRRHFFASGRRREDGAIDLVPATRDWFPAPRPVRGQTPKQAPRPLTTPDTDPTFAQQAN